MLFLSANSSRTCNVGAFLSQTATLQNLKLWLSLSTIKCLRQRKCIYWSEFFERIVLGGINLHFHVGDMPNHRKISQFCAIPGYVWTRHYFRILRDSSLTSDPACLWTVTLILTILKKTFSLNSKKKKKIVATLQISYNPLFSIQSIYFGGKTIVRISGRWSYVWHEIMLTIQRIVQLLSQSIRLESIFHVLYRVKLNSNRLNGFWSWSSFCFKAWCHVELCGHQRS